MEKLLFVVRSLKKRLVINLESLLLHGNEDFREQILDREEKKGGKSKEKAHMARKGNPISVRLDLNRSSDSSWFSEGDRESHRMGQSFPLVCPKKKSVGGRCRCPGRTRLLLTLENHRKTPGTRACRERSTLGARASTVSPGHS